MSKEESIVVKFMAKKLTPETELTWSRQLPGHEKKWGNCRFEFDQNSNVYDWLVVYDDVSPVTDERFSVRVESLACPAEHTILVTSEPSSVKCYSSLFCEQFDLVITTHEPWAIEHRNILRTQTGYPWFYHRSSAGENTGLGKIGYDDIKSSPPENKSELISTVCSDKRRRGHTLHNARADFTDWLSKQMPEMTRYGRGVRYLDDKADALDSFRYHVAIENDCVPDYFTEKLLDPFLGLTLPFYFGCPNTPVYFPEESFIPIDIFDFEGSLQTIRRAIENNEYEKRLPSIKEARRRVLDEHNIFALLSREIEKRHNPGLQCEPGHKIFSRRAMRNKSVRNFLITVFEKNRLERRQAKHRPAF